MRPLFSRTQELRAQAPRGWRGKLWRWLTEPAATLQEPHRRRQAQLLASLLTALFLIGAALEGVTILWRRFCGWRTQKLRAAHTTENP